MSKAKNDLKIIIDLGYDESLYPAMYPTLVKEIEEVIETNMDSVLKAKVKKIFLKKAFFEVYPEREKI